MASFHKALPGTTVKLINVNAVIGIVTKDTTNRGLTVLRDHDLNDASGAIGQSHPAMRMRFELRIGDHAARPHSHYALQAERASIGVADVHGIKRVVSVHGLLQQQTHVKRQNKNFTEFAETWLFIAFQ